MAQGITGGARQQPKEEIVDLGTDHKVVLEKIQVVKRRHQIDIPEYHFVEKETIKYVPKTEPTVKYEVTTKPTVQFEVRTEPTIKYEVETEKTTKYVAEEIRCEKPVLIDKPYERPVVTNKEYTIVTFADMEAIRELMDVAPKLLAQLKGIRDYQIVKEVIKVPDIKYVPTTIKKIKNTGELIDDAD
jgi:hypothetical protein